MKDIIIQCNKCTHLVYINKKKFINNIGKIPSWNCPECGEEGYLNWIIYGEGNLNEKGRDYCRN